MAILKRKKALIADLHCDLLAYVAEKNNFMHPEVRCSLPQLQAGNVHFQTLAIFTETKKGSVRSAIHQFQCYQTLLQHDAFIQWDGQFPQDKIALLPAVENASGLCEEDEDLDLSFERLLPSLLYVSLTWNSENRFGGGNHTKVGLKRDGEIFLDYLDKKKVAIDLSHASDYLAHDVLEYIDKKGLKVTPIASHSNLRKVEDDPRNLPDEIAKEIMKRGGVIGINFVRKFLGKKPPEGILRHINHIRELKGEDHVCFGADFFFDGTVAPLLHHLLPFFYKGFGDASCYPKVLEALGEEEMAKIAYKNFEAYLMREGLCT